MMGRAFAGRKHLAFIFSLEAAFSLTLVVVAAAYLFAFAQPKEDAGEFLICSDIAGALSEARAFSSQEALAAAVDEAGALSGVYVEADGAGFRASSCPEEDAAGGQTYSFSYPVWAGGRLQEAQVKCRPMNGK